MAWPWTTREDRVICERAARAVDDAGTRLRATGAIARQFEPGDELRPRAPWASWSLCLAAQLGTSEPESLVLAIAVLVDTGPDESEQLGCALALLDARGLTRAEVAQLLLDVRLLPRPAWPCVDDGTHESDVTPARLALLWGLCALAAGRDTPSWMPFALELAELLAIFQGLLDLADDGPHLGPPRVAALLRACRDQAGARELLLDACAGGLEHEERRRALVHAATSPAVLEQLNRERERLFARTQAALPSRDAEPGAAFLVALRDQFTQLTGALWMRGVMARAMPAPTSEASTIAASVSAAVDYLAQTRPWAGAWDVHRFHPMGAPCVLVGRLFIEGMILLALAELGRDDRSVEIAALLERVPPAQARYFPEWPGLPPDADSLGLLLQLVTWLPRPPQDRLDSWIAVLDASLGADAIVPTWFEHGPAGRTTPLAGPFLGDECTGVSQAFLLGALRHGERFASLVRPNVEAILARGCEAGCLHYTQEFATHTLLRLIAGLRDHASPQLAALVGELGLDVIANDRCAALAANQRMDGGWGSPQATALALEGLACWDPSSRCIARACTHLVHSQGPDGAWPAEPLYITPGKFGGMVPFSAKALTTALCVRALQRANDELAR